MNKIYNNLTIDNLMKTDLFNQFDKKQQEEISLGLKNKIDVSIYANKIFDNNKMKEIRFKPSFNIFDIQSVLVYKWSVNDVINNQIQNQVKAEEEQQNKENSQIN